jgi:hypothetical protein
MSHHLVGSESFPRPSVGWQEFCVVLTLLSTGQSTFQTPFTLHDSLGDKVDQSPLALHSIARGESPSGFSFRRIEFKGLLKTFRRSLLICWRGILQIPDTDGGERWRVARETLEGVQPVLMRFRAMVACTGSKCQGRAHDISDVVLPCISHSA